MDLRTLEEICLVMEMILLFVMSGTVPIERATGAFPIMNTNSGATIPRPGFRPDPFASNLVLLQLFRPH